MLQLLYYFIGLYSNYCIVSVLQFLYLVFFVLQLLFFVVFILQLLFFVAFILQLLFFVIFILQLLFFVYTICCNHCTMRCNHCTTRCISFFWLFFCQNTITAVTIQYNKCFLSFFFLSAEFICFPTMLAPIISSLDEIYCA